MSLASFFATINQALGDGKYSADAQPTNDPKADTATAVTDLATLTTAIAAAVTAEPSYTTVAADIATLVSDGASPTQAHVNALNTAWGTFKTAQDAFVADVSALSTATVSADLTKITADLGGDVTVAINLATITNMNQLHAALAKILQTVKGTGKLTP